MMTLQQICNHSAQYLKKGKNDAMQSGKHEKVLVFTQFRVMGDSLSQ